MAHKKMTIESLAAASQAQFLTLEKKIDTIEGKVDLVLSALDNLSSQIADVICAAKISARPMTW